MIFVLRAIMVSLAFFAILYSVLSLFIAAIWRSLPLFHLQKRIGARGLITLRFFPFVASSCVTVFLTLPSFLLLEQHSLDEDLGTFALSACAIVILSAGIYRVWTAELRTRRFVSCCLQRALRTQPNAVAPPVIVARDVAPLMMVGIRVPRILISTAACEMLSASELKAAVRHEEAHFRSRDNLKKAILNLLPFPGMSSLEKAWHEASEFAADHQAVSTRGEALDLAAALIKLARHCPAHEVPQLATGLVTTIGSISTRVERLMTWCEPSNGSPYRRHYAVALAFVALLALFAKLGPALILIHSLTDRLVP